MTTFRRDAAGHACLGAARLRDVLLDAGVPTPAYVYDLDGIGDATRRVVAAFGAAPGLVAYAVKANAAGSIVRTIGAAGAGADVVSGAELAVALAAGIAPDHVVMSGVAKTNDEIDLAISRDIRTLQIESLEEIERVASRARALGKTTNVSLRLNPNVRFETHAHIATGHDEAKFGIAVADAEAAWARVDAEASLRAIGASVHVGSMLADTEPYTDAARVVVEQAKRRASAGRPLSQVNFGGGFGIDYGGRPVRPPEAFVESAVRLLAESGLASLTLVVEPGRSLVGPFGVLLAGVVQAKNTANRSFLLVDAGMNDLLRPALYGARHRVEALDQPPTGRSFRVVGPVCESSDDFGDHVVGGDEAPTCVAIRDVGAYGFSMASEYNGRALPAEIFLRAGRIASVSPSAGAACWVDRRLGA